MVFTLYHGRLLLGESLPSTNINTLLAARDGTLWIGTLKGLASWNSDKLTQYPDFAGGSSHVLLEDHEGTVWVGASGKLCAIRAKTIQCYGYGTSSVTGLHYLYSNQITASSMYEDSDYRLWVGTETGLWRWKPGTPKRYMPQPLIADQAVVPGDRAGELVFISGAKNDLQQLAGQRINEYTVPGIRRAVNASCLLRDRNGALWIGTYDQGLLRVYRGKASRFAIGEGLSGNLVTALFEDREGSVWVGTTSGVDRFSKPVISTLSASQGLPSPAWSVLPAHDGSVWIGSFDGLSRLRQGKLTTYRSTRTSGKQIGQSTAVDGAVREIITPGLPGNNIGSLCEDKRGRIWITTTKGVARFENGRLTRVIGLPAGSANDIIADEYDGVWISYPAQGLFHFVHGTFDQFTPWPRSSDGKVPRISAIVPDPLNSGLWLGSIDAGIARLNDGQVSKWLGSKNGLGANLVWNLHVDHEGTLWAATEGGLSRIKDGTVSTLTTKSGLPCNAVHWVTEDDASSLWLSTVCGLLRVDRSDLQAWTSDAKHAINATMFDGSDGFRSHAMLIGYSPVVKKSPDGKLWFAHNDGVSVFDPQHLPLNKLTPPVYIQQITADGKKYDASLGLRLPPQVRDLYDRLHGAEPGCTGEGSLPLQAGGAGQGLERSRQRTPSGVLESAAASLPLPRDGQQQQRRVERARRVPGLHASSPPTGRRTGSAHCVWPLSSPYFGRLICCVFGNCGSRNGSFGMWSKPFRRLRGPPCRMAGWTFPITIGRNIRVYPSRREPA